MATALDSLSSLAGSSAGSTAATSNSNEAGSADRFLKLLVTQMQNQDPLNPMDNAQITSQMAQINTVTGVEKLNTTVAGLNSQFVQMQALQGASLVGHDVTIAGNKLVVEQGQASGGVELASSADHVKVEVLNGAGLVVDTLQLGAQSSGRLGFHWQAPASATDGSRYSFRVTATAGSAAVSATALMRDHVDAVSLENGNLRLDTTLSGRIDYSAVKAVN